MRKSSHPILCLGIPVVPPVSKMLKGRSANACGTQTLLGRSRNHSSSKYGNLLQSSAKVRTSFKGLKSCSFAQFNQKGHPLSGEKCQLIISSTCWSRSLAACLICSSLTITGIISSRIPSDSQSRPRRKELIDS